MLLIASTTPPLKYTNPVQSYILHSSPIVPNVIASSQVVQQVPLIGQLPDPTSSTTLSPIRPGLTTANDIENFTALSFSLVPPVPQKLIERIQAGHFIDMSKLLSDHMGVLNSEENPRSSKPKWRNVTNVLEWAHCFALYKSILSWKQPQRVPDLLGYQSLILLASMAFEGDGWQGYDRVFRQNAAANSLTTWTTIDSTLWGVENGWLLTVSIALVSVIPQQTVPGPPIPVYPTPFHLLSHHAVIPLQTVPTPCNVDPEFALPGTIIPTLVAPCLIVPMTIPVLIVSIVPAFKTRDTKPGFVRTNLNNPAEDQIIKTADLPISTRKISID